MKSKNNNKVIWKLSNVWQKKQIRLLFHCEALSWSWIPDLIQEGNMGLTKAVDKALTIPAISSVLYDW